MKDDIDLVHDLYRTYADKDRAVIEGILAEVFCFTSPLDNCIDRKTYFERCWPLSKDVVSFDLIFSCANGPRVFVTYEAMHKDGRKFRNTEIAIIENGSVKAVEVYFGWDLPHKAKEGGFIDAPP